MRLIMVVTNDKYELPVAIGETYEEVGRVFGFTKHAIHKAFKRNNTIYHKKYRVVEVLE